VRQSSSHAELPELLHPREPVVDAVDLGMARPKVEKQLGGANLPSLCDVLTDLFQSSMEVHAVCPERFGGELHVGPHHQLERLGIASDPASHLLHRVKLQRRFAPTDITPVGPSPGGVDG
jgi:hypothetical protein